MAERHLAIADTSVFVGLEADRIPRSAFADFDWGVSVVVLGELRLGVLRAQDAKSTAQRLATYQVALQFDPIPIDTAVSDAWALLVAKLRADGRKVGLNDSWIAATALAYELPLVTQDRDYEAIADLEVIWL